LDNQYENGATAIIGTNGIGGGQLTVTFNDTANEAQAPEPASLALIGIGLAGLGFGRGRKA